MISDYLKEMRLTHWYKALIVFSGPLFGGALLSSSLLRLIMSFFAFGLVASSIYVINDLKDAEKDRLHPKKKERPIASGKIDAKNAVIFSSALLLSSLLLAWAVDRTVLWLVLCYFFLMLLYTFFLKEIAVIDAFAIAGGFVIRALAGCFAAGIEVTTWFYLVIFFFAIYLAFCKRLTELSLAGKEHKNSLAVYEHLSEIGIAISGSATLSMYAIYTLEKSGLVMWSVPLAFLGMLLHLRETFAGKEVHESLKSPELILTGLAFIVIVLLSLY